MAIPHTVADLEAEIHGRCAIALQQAGVLFRAVDGAGSPITPAVREGIRRGVKCVGVATADPLLVADPDLANLSGFALERIEDEAELFALQRALMTWHLAVAKYAQAPVEATPMTGGWLMEEKRAVKDRVSELRRECSEPYREPSDTVVQVHHQPVHVYGYGDRRGCLRPDGGLPIETCYDPYYGPWYW